MAAKPSKVAALRDAREAQASLPARVDAVTAMVDGIETVGDARTVARAATAMKELAKQAGLSLDEQNRASRAKLAAMRRGGAMLADLERGEAGRPPDNAPNAGRIISPYRETLAEAELTRGEASRWMRLAAFGDDEWAEVLGSCTDELTTGYVLRQWRPQGSRPSNLGTGVVRMRPATGGPAFPRPASEYTASGTLDDGNDAIREQGGMYLRQWYAGQALVGLLASDTGGHTRHVAQIAFEYADAMIAHELEGS